MHECLSEMPACLRSHLSWTQCSFATRTRRTSQLISKICKSAACSLNQDLIEFKLSRWGKHSTQLELGISFWLDHPYIGLIFLHFDQRKLEVSLNTRALRWLTTSLSQPNHRDLFFYLVPSIPQLRHMSERLQWQIPAYQNNFNAWLICIMLIRRLKSHQMDDNVSAGGPVIECRLSSAGAERQSITASLENCYDWETETMLRYSDKREALIMF